MLHHELDRRKCLTGESVFHFPSRVDYFSEALRMLKPGGILVTADTVPNRTVLNWRFRRKIERLGWGGAPAKAARKAADVIAYRDLLFDVGFAEAETRSIAGDIFRPLAKFLSKSLFAPDRKVCESASPVDRSAGQLLDTRMPCGVHPGGGAKGVTRRQ